MGQFAYLINREHKIRAEAFKISSAGEASNAIEEPDELALFMRHCMENDLVIECVSEHFFDDIDFTDKDELYRDLK